MGQNSWDVVGVNGRMQKNLLPSNGVIDLKLLVGVIVSITSACTPGSLISSSSTIMRIPLTKCPEQSEVLPGNASFVLTFLIPLRAHVPSPPARPGVPHVRRQWQQVSWSVAAQLSDSTASARQPWQHRSTNIILYY